MKYKNVKKDATCRLLHQHCENLRALGANNFVLVLFQLCDGYTKVQNNQDQDLLYIQAISRL